MNLEQLNKSQLVLLALLVSFMTSIATGIVTVSLMEQAPPVVSQTVNRVVERTIETVVPAAQTAASATVRERTVVVKESDLISQAVAKISPSVVRVYVDQTESAEFLGLGVVITTDGMIAIDADVLGAGTNATVALSDGTRVAATLAVKDAKTGVAVLQATSTAGTSASPVTWKPAAIASDNPVLGQTVFAVAGRTVVRVEDGIISAIIPGEKEGDTSITIDTNISADATVSGSPLVNTNGELVGLSTSVSRTASAKGFMSAKVLIKESPKDTASAAKPASGGTQ